MLFFAGFFMKINIRKLFFHQKVSLQVHEYTFLTPAGKESTSMRLRISGIYDGRGSHCASARDIFLPGTSAAGILVDRQRKVQTCTERIGEEISQYGLLMDTDPEEGK